MVKQYNMYESFCEYCTNIRCVFFGEKEERNGFGQNRKRQNRTINKQIWFIVYYVLSKLTQMPENT